MNIIYRGPSIDASYQMKSNFVGSMISFDQAVSEENIFLIAHSETIIACGDHVGYRIATKCAIFIEDLR